MSLDLNELRELLAAINLTDIAELTLKSADFELTVRRASRAEAVIGMAASVTPALSVPPTPISVTQAVGGTAEAPALPTGPSAPPPTSDRRLLEILSPMVGTFYRAPSPDESPFVEVGDRVRKGQTVCIIEAMKLMNELESEVDGEIVEVLVQNGEPVEYGQLLMRVTPN